MRDDLAVAINPNERLPVFLIDSYEAKEKSYAAPLDESTPEAVTADRVRREVQALVELEIADGAVPLGPTFTSSHMTPYGPGVYGISVIGRRRT